MPLARLDALPLVHGYAGLGPDFSCDMQPQGLRGAELLHLSRAGCALIDLDPDSVDPERATAWFAGGELLPGAQPIAMVYSGHQFGVWAGQLGDGRAHLLGEVRNRAGETWDLQLKGSGRTPFSRMGDGRAVLRSTLREYVAGEAMAGLGIPSTRALAIFRSDEPIEREETETGALLVRLARCHVRLGTFEHFHASGRLDLARRLFGYSLGRWYPHLTGRGRRVELFLEEVTARNARLVAQWMAVGFCHGVMNTDNTSILGETIDFGPYAFMDDFQSDHVCNCTDVDGRYAYARQPQVMLWNLQRFAEAMAPLVPDVKLQALQERVQAVFAATFGEAYGGLMAAKLGLAADAPELPTLVQATLDVLERGALDHTGFWRTLSRAELVDAPAELLAFVGESEAFRAWWPRYRAARQAASAGADEAATRAAMLWVNPKFVLRNYLVQAVIEEPDVGRQRAQLEDLLEVLAAPCDEHPAHEALAAPPVGAQKAIQVSCSS